jgi:predicted component of type VI protein secretion system
MLSLRLVPVSGNPFDIARDPSVVGRDPGCEIVVTDGSVSRRHARLEFRGDAWWVVDQGSANGTYVNSLKVAETALKDGQELRFGALAFRVDIAEDPEATVSSPILPEATETVMAAPTPDLSDTPPPMPVAPVIPPPPLPSAAATPPPPPPAGGAAGARPGGASPVPPMAGGPPPAKKGRGPVFWIAVGCCGCVLLVMLLGGLLGGGAYVMTRGVADAAHGWITDVRAGGADAAVAGMTGACASRISDDELDALVMAIQDSTDATLPSRAVENDRAVLTGVLTGTGAPRAIVLQLVQEDGGWKVDDVRIDDVATTFGE